MKREAFEKGFGRPENSGRALAFLFLTRYHRGFAETPWRPASRGWEYFANSLSSQWTVRIITRRSDRLQDVAFTRSMTIWETLWSATPLMASKAHGAMYILLLCVHAKGPAGYPLESI